MSRDRVMQIGLVVLAIPAVVVGGWAGLAPRSFYDDFPGFSAWVSPDGPYNEHLVRDVGWLNLALALVTLLAAWTLARALVGAALGAWLVYGVPHLVYHLRHLDAYDTGDQISMIASLAVAPVVVVLLLALGRPRARNEPKMRASEAAARSSPSSP